MTDQQPPTYWNIIKPVGPLSFHRFKRCTITGKRLGFGEAIEVRATCNGELTHRWFISAAAYGLAFLMPSVHERVSDRLVAVLKDMEAE